MLKYLLVLAIPLFDFSGVVRFKQQSSADPKDVIETVRTAFPHAHCDFIPADSIYMVDNFVNFDKVFFVNRMQQFGIQVSVIEADEK